MIKSQQVERGTLFLPPLPGHWGKPLLGRQGCQVSSIPFRETSGAKRETNFLCVMSQWQGRKQEGG